MPGTSFFPRVDYQVRRGMLELLHERTFTKAEWLEGKQFFRQRCVYCGKLDTGDPRTGLVPDHLIAVVHGGAHCVGNIVPACHDCNDRRGRLDWREFLRSDQGPKAPARTRLIAQYLKLHPYVSRAKGRGDLTPREAAEYDGILEAWGLMWTRAKKLRDGIRVRRRERKRARPPR